MDQSGVPHNRRPHRAPVLLTATLHVGGKAHPVKLRNLSEDGALVESDDFPPEGIDAIFERNALRVRSSVVWVEGHFAGIRFGRPLKSEDVLRRVAKPRTPKQLEFKRPGLASRPLSAYERSMLEHWIADARST